MRAFIRYGYMPRDITKEFAAHGRRLSRAAKRPRQETPTKDDDWVQVLTLWTMDPEYVDERGNPRVLRARGAAPSLEALVRRVDSKGTTQNVCRNLIRTGAARKVGTKYIAVAHGPILFPSGSKDQAAYHL